MQYSERDLRAVDMLALVLTGFGIAAAVLGVLLWRARWVPCGLALTALGLALNAKLRRILHAGGFEDTAIAKPTSSGADHLDG